MFKRVLTIVLVGLFAGASVFAENAQGPTQVQDQSTTVGVGVSQVGLAGVADSQSQSQSDSSAQSDSDSDSTSDSTSESSALSVLGVGIDIMSNPSIVIQSSPSRVSPVHPGRADLAWALPPKPWLWNSYLEELLMVYHRKWTFDEAETPLRRIPHRGPLEAIGSLFNGGASYKGKGFTRIVTLSDYSPRPKTEEKATFTTFVAVNRENLFRENTYIGSINVTGRADTMSPDQCLRAAVREAYEYDLDVGVIGLGMNPINDATGVSSGMGFNAATIQNNFAVIGSVGRARTRTMGEPGVIMFVFRKNGAVAPPDPPAATPDVTEKDIRELMDEEREILLKQQKREEQLRREQEKNRTSKEKPWGWGVGVSDELGQKAQGLGR